MCLLHLELRTNYNCHRFTSLLYRLYLFRFPLCARSGCQRLRGVCRHAAPISCGPDTAWLRGTHSCPLCCLVWTLLSSRGSPQDWGVSLHPWQAWIHTSALGGLQWTWQVSRGFAGGKADTVSLSWYHSRLNICHFEPLSLTVHNLNYERSILKLNSAFNSSLTDLSNDVLRS